jgi:predicted TIM-barrel fold metal-dependent hydrolase
VKGTIKDNPVAKLMEELNLNEQDKANILGENAKKIFKL